jgi:hypothetical protein
VRVKDGKWPSPPEAADSHCINIGLRDPGIAEPREKADTVAKPNYGYEKRQKELAKQKKKAEKQQKKLERAQHPSDEQQEQSQENTGPPAEGSEGS